MMADGENLRHCGLLRVLRGSRVTRGEAGNGADATRAVSAWVSALPSVLAQSSESCSGRKFHLDITCLQAIYHSFILYTMIRYRTGGRLWWRRRRRGEDTRDTA